jgi:hypothetical protein
MQMFQVSEILLISISYTFSLLSWAYILFLYLFTCLLTYLLTYSLHGAGYYLKSFQSLRFSNNRLLSLWDPKIHYRAHKNLLSDPILSQPSLVLPIDYFPKVHLNVILPPTPTSSQWSLTFGPPNQYPLNTSPLPRACHRFWGWQWLSIMSIVGLKHQRYWTLGSLYHSLSYIMCLLCYSW